MSAVDDKTTFLEGFAAQLPEEDYAHFLVYEPEPGREEWIEITADPILIGRSGDSSVRLVDTLVSGRHCRVRLGGKMVIAEDLGSTNGTFIDRRQVTEAEPVPVGSVLVVGRCRLRHEVKTREEVVRRQQRAMELERASSYVQSLLPPPVTEGAVRTAWRFIPSTHLGGDAFGHHWLDEDRFAFYLLDVCGHGAGAALHSVAVLNFLRRGSHADLDLTRPAAVLEELNHVFPMEEAGGMYFTIWYGVFDRSSRRLAFASAGHPPAYLRVPGSEGVRPLSTDNLAAGMLPESLFDQETEILPEGSRVYVFSDGVFEFWTPEREPFDFDRFVPILAEPEEPGLAETARIEKAMRSRMATETFPDDFSLLVVEFP
jgi:serine phosphatase RsbU (regulator of sigma subunit)